MKKAIFRAFLGITVAATILFAVLGCGSSQPVAPQTVAHPPIIAAISPDTGALGTEVTVSGSNFRESQGEGSLAFAGVTATCKSWSDSRIVAAVPNGAKTGEVRVSTGEGTSNPIGFTISTPPPAPPPAPTGIPWDQAKSHIGENATVNGPVLGGKWATSSKGQPTFLNVGRNYPDPARFTVLIWGENRANFPGPPETYYAGKTISVTGLIESYQGSAEIIVSSPSQIQVLE